MICEIHTSFIRLEALLKLAGVVVSGGQAKTSIQNGEIRVNGDICRERGRKLRAGDKVLFDGREVEVASEAPKTDG